MACHWLPRRLPTPAHATATASPEAGNLDAATAHFASGQDDAVTPLAKPNPKKCLGRWKPYAESETAHER
jgi:hypothetical protein